MSKSLRTHYDNLMVSRSAPAEVIAAAYRTLSKRLHPDANPGDPRAERVMRIINTSYAVLSDPVKRRAHDEWIRTNEREAVHGNSPAPMPPTASVAKSSGIGRHVGNYWALYLVAGLIVAGIFADKTPPSPSGLPQYVAKPSSNEAEAQQPEDPSEPSYIRPLAAPNGSSWPNGPSYVRDYPIARADGLSKLTVDNQSNSTDMFVKLVALDADQSLPIRHAYIPANQSFTMSDIRVGKYDVRYMDLADGSLARSEEFDLQEIADAGGTSFSVMTMTLYKVSNGNMQTYPLAADEF